MTRSTLEQALGFDIPLIVPIMLILYIAVIMVVGLWAAKKVKNSEDWFVGGRSMANHGSQLWHTDPVLWVAVCISPFRSTAGRQEPLLSGQLPEMCSEPILEFRYHRQENEKIYRKSQSTDYS